MKKVLLALVVGLVLAGAWSVKADDATQSLLNPWKVVSGYITTRIAGNGLKVPSLSSSGNCVVTDSSGIFSTASCGTGGGGSGGGFATSTGANGAVITNTYGGAVGINSSTPWATLTVVGKSASTTPVFVVASSTNARLLTVASNGSTTLSSLGTGPVYSSSGSLFNNGTTGTGLTVQQTSPTLITPILGVASGTALTLSGNLWAASTSITGTLSVTGSTTLSSLGTGFVKSTSGGALFVDNSAYITLTSLSGTAPISYNNGSGAISCPTCVTNSYASSSFFTLWNTQAGSNITITTSSNPTIAVSSSPSFTGLTISGISGSTQCLHVNSSGVVSGTGSDCGAGGGGSGGGWATSTTANGLIITNTSGGAVGINSSTPWGHLVVQGVSASTTPVLIVASSSGTSYLTVASNGSTTLSSLGAGFVKSTSAGSLFVDGTTYLSTIGSGSTGFHAIWNGANTLTQGVVRDNGTVAGVNATSSTISFNVQGSGTLNPFNVSSSSGTSYLTVTQNGLVGVNSSTPIGTLAVKGQAGSTAPLVVASSTGSILLQVDANGSTTLSSLASAGCVASTGSGQLYVTTCGGGSLSGGTNGYLTRWLSASTVGTGVSIDNGSVAGVNATSSTVSFNVQGSGTLDPFNVSSSTGTSYLRVTRAGSVGVGTSTPVGNLMIQGTSGQSANYLTIASSSGATVMSIAPNSFPQFTLGTSTGSSLAMAYLIGNTASTTLPLLRGQENNETISPSLYKSSPSTFYTIGAASDVRVV